MLTANILTRSGDRANSAGSIVSVEQDQLSAAQYRFRLEGKRMYGILVSSHVSGHSELTSRTVDSELRQEMAIWDSLSDEALLEFEDSIA